MAVSDKNLVISPNISSTTDDPKIVFSGADASTSAQTITARMYPTSNGTLSFEGSTGQLFSITNSMSGTIYSVNDVSGMPSIEILDTGLIKFGQYSGKVLIGTGTDNGVDKLQVSGSISSTSLQLENSIEQGNNYAHPNVEWAVAGSNTGEVIFYLPGNTSNYGMVHMVFDYYEYNSPRTATIIIAGHNWSTAWYNYSCNVVGFIDKPVRVGVKGGRFCVVFGNSGSSWSYGQIRLRKVNNGGYYNNIMDLGGNWSTELTAVESFSWISNDLRELRTPGYMYATRFCDGDDNTYYCDPASTSTLNTLRLSGGHMYITTSDPTIHFVDTNERGAALHTNSNLFYILSSNGTGGESWTQNNGYWPVYWNLNDNNATFGGTIWAAGNITAYSDIKLKENIYTIQKSLEKVLQLRGVYYTLKLDETKKRKIGLIAQEVQEILPEVVLEHKDIEDTEGTLSVDYGNITAILIEAIKEQQLKIEELSEQNKNLLSRVSTLESLL